MPASRPSSRAGSQPAQISIPGRTWAALIAAFLIVTALLALTAVTLISQRQKTVLLNKQLGALVSEATLALHATQPALGALPASSTTIRSRARAAARLVTEARTLITQLQAVGLPSTISSAGQLVSALAQQNRLITTLQDISALTDGLQRYQLLPRTSAGLDDLHRLVVLQARALQIQEASLLTQQDTRQTAHRTLAAAQATLAQAHHLLFVAKQTLVHAANLDRKVGPVP